MLNKALILNNILRLVEVETKQVNKNAVFDGPHSQDWDLIAVLNAVHIGELALKSVIAKENVLLVFKNVFDLDDKNQNLTIERLLEKGKSHDLSKLPQILWAVTGQRVNNIELFNQAIRVRNQIQHFMFPENENLSEIALRFVYEVADPLLVENFGFYPVLWHDNPDEEGYLVNMLFRNEIKFSPPPMYDVSRLEGDPLDSLDGCSEPYKQWFADVTRR